MGGGGSWDRWLDESERGEWGERGEVGLPEIGSRSVEKLESLVRDGLEEVVEGWNESSLDEKEVLEADEELGGRKRG